MMPEIIASDAVPPDRMLVSSARARLENVKVRCEPGDDGAVTIRMSADVVYQPGYQCVIRLGEAG